MKTLPILFLTPALLVGLLLGGCIGDMDKKNGEVIAFMVRKMVEEAELGPDDLVILQLRVKGDPVSLNKFGEVKGATNALAPSFKPYPESAEALQEHFSSATGASTQLLSVRILQWPEPNVAKVDARLGTAALGGFGGVVRVFRHPDSGTISIRSTEESYRH